MNTLGKKFTVTTFGESHGPAMGCIVDGCPAGFALTETDIQKDLDKRRPGQSKVTSQRCEADKVKILSGVFEGKTTGTPIALQIENTDAKSKDYDEIKDKFRPGHGDYTYFHKYKHYDYRGAGRASARETVNWVAAGAIARKYLKAHYNIDIIAYLSQLGEVAIDTFDLNEIENNVFFTPDKNKVPVFEEMIHHIRKQGDSLGARVNIIAKQVPVGLGEPIFYKCDAAIAQAMMTINAVKGVEIGAGFDAITQTGHEHRDEITQTGFLSNNAGGILAGISTGQDILVSIAVKPPSSILKSAKTLTKSGEETTISTKGRHDPCVGIRAVPVAKAMMALVLMDMMMLKIELDV